MSRIPKLRFKEFNGDWKFSTLGSYFTFKNGINATKEQYGKGYKFINVLDIINNNTITHKNIIGSVDVKKDIFEKNIVEYGDILFQRSSEVREDAGQSIVYLDKEIPATFGGFVIRGKAKQDYYPEFMNYMLKTNLARKEITTKSNGSTRYNVGQETLSKVFIYVPLQQEQEKIASCLTSVDTKIEQLTKKETLLKEYKKGVMQKIFNQEIRFKDDDGSEFCDWEETRLKEILDYEQPTKYIVESTEYNNSYNTPVLTAGKTFILGYTNEKNGVYVNSPVIIFDDFTTANHYVNFNFKVKSSAMKLLKVKHQDINLKFVYEFIQKLHFPIGEHKRYWISEYSYLKIKLPSFDEQTKIANFLSTIDTKLEQTQKQLEQTKEFKKALLQQMFV
ncbi:hypothetical protein ALC152_22140 [Arcobacter sp. 15-2]|uniref:restriction endonuclease subunit S n=1 Tax=Arcobacter sp. 15-2 TaxID=3374109 RepID=UPI00399D0080